MMKLADVRHKSIKLYSSLNNWITFELNKNGQENSKCSCRPVKTQPHLTELRYGLNLYLANILMKKWAGNEWAEHMKTHLTVAFAILYEMVLVFTVNAIISVS